MVPLPRRFAAREDSERRPAPPVYPPTRSELRSGGGGPCAAWWKGKGQPPTMREAPRTIAAAEALGAPDEGRRRDCSGRDRDDRRPSLAPPPPCSAWSPPPLRGSPRGRIAPASRRRPPASPAPGSFARRRRPF